MLNRFIFLYDKWTICYRGKVTKYKIGNLRPGDKSFTPFQIAWLNRRQVPISDNTTINHSLATELFILVVV